MPVMLPTKPKLEVRTGFPWSSTWLVGSPPKVGKSKLIEGVWRTTIAHGAEKKVLHIDLENSAEDLTGYIVQPASLQELRELIAQLQVNCPFAAIAIDTIDVLNTWCEEETIRELRANIADLQVMGDDRVGYGKDWALARGKVADTIDRLKMLGKLLFIVAHTKVEKGQYSGVNLALPTGLGVRVRGSCQVIAYLMAVEGGRGVQRILTFTPSDSTIAGSRYAELNNQAVTIPLQEKDKDGKGWVDWSPVFALFGQLPNGQPLPKGAKP